jgi:hypothetical protein
VSQAKVQRQALEIEELKRQLALRPQNVDGEVARLKLEVDQLNEIISMCLGYDMRPPLIPACRGL